ncbi:histidine kinase [Draconibacterium sp. IB214405]|uniref:sensor histidine kinase n=1 Tax=Draconibacterium sp. IB214405 TaxID=3097352 RepID=UPI002A0AEAD6|nr:histidine kinase [Draconibacterium sp. IB214405]MDX8341639.1 histidine kinase [Draconibacterium sp. IB214405]
MAKFQLNKQTKKQVLKHLAILAGAVAICIIFSLVLFQRILHPGIWNMLLLTVIQLELFMYLGIRFFKSVDPDAPGAIKKTIVRLILFYITVLLIAFALFLAIFTWHFWRAGAPFSEFIPNLVNTEIRSFLTAAGVGFALGALFFFYTQWADTVKRMQKLKEEKLIFQYETLKTQVNPHFLFNSLNTLSSLVNSNPELSDKFIHKLSAVYRYVLENQEKDLVPLADEMEFVKDFFYLQKIRDGEKIELKIDFGETGTAKIIPVSLQMLVENAIKHNAATRKDPLLITIHFEGMDKLVVRNDLRQRMQLAASSKIGLKNLNERCKLILKRDVEIQETEDEFVVKVPLKLNEQSK